jgi:hypothetical protein
MYEYGIVCIESNTLTHIHIYTYIYIHIHTYTYIYIHIHTEKESQIPSNDIILILYSVLYIAHMKL